MRIDDLILFVVIFGSAAAAVFLPDAGRIFQPYLLCFMMLLLFLSFLKIDFGALLDTSRGSLLRLATMASVKLIILPTALYAIALFVMPDYAVPILLLSGISTGVVAPFLATLVAADVATVLRMVIITSLVVPLSLPCLVKLLAGAELSIPLDLMIRLLALVIFVPMGSVLVLRKFVPRALEKIAQWQYPVSLLLFALVNLGVFSKYSSFFFQHPGKLLVCLAVAYALSVIYYLTGFLLVPGRQVRERLAAAVSLAVMNNVLVIVFSSHFFGPLSPTLAAMYMFPFFTMIVPVKLIAHRVEWAAGKPEKA
ncbi:MAG: bile acid:sodium symporter [Desulfomonilaceae bacterium]